MTIPTDIMALIASSMVILGRDDLFFGEKEEKTLRRNKSRGDKDGHLRLLFEIGQFIRHKTEDKISFLWKFDKDGLAERILFVWRRRHRSVVWRRGRYSSQPGYW